MRSIRKDVASRVAKMEIEQERRAAIAKKNKMLSTETPGIFKIKWME